MANIGDEASLRRRVIGAAEVACAAWAVIGHSVLHVLPNETPLLVLLALLSMRWRDEDWPALGFVRPRSWRRVILLAVGAAELRIALGDLVIGPLTAHVWPPAAAPKGAQPITHDAMAALAALGVAWTFAAFGQEIGYRGYLMRRIADVGGGTRAAWLAGLLGSAVLFGLGSVCNGPVDVLDSGVAGLILGGVYLLSGRCLWTAILAHGLIGATAVVVAYLGLNG